MIEPRSSGMCFTSSPILSSMGKTGSKVSQDSITFHYPLHTTSPRVCQYHPPVVTQMAQDTNKSLSSTKLRTPADVLDNQILMEWVFYLKFVCLRWLNNLHEGLWQKSLSFGVSSLSLSSVRPNVFLPPSPQMQIYTHKHH